MEIDPKPQPPREPQLEDCCGNGCTPCVFDLYAEALERYQLALAAWEGRHQKKKRTRRRKPVQ